MKENLLIDKSIVFASRIVKLYQHLTKTKKETIISKQIIRSATSIGANANEAIYGVSKADFISKMKIALKECYETEYWLELMQKANLLPDDTVKGYLHDCGSIRRMLIASLNTAKGNTKEKN